MSLNHMRFGDAEVMPQKTETVLPYTTTNTVLYGANDFLVIDPGSTDEEEQDRLIARIEEKMDQGNFLAILITHHHGDHMGGAQKISQHFRVPIRGGQGHQALPVIELRDNEELKLGNSTLTALFTPGHAHDHFAFYDAMSQVLVAGDMITDRGVTLIPPNGHLRTYLFQLNRLSDLCLNVIIPAHGNAITVEPKQFLLKALKHRYHRLYMVFQQLSASETLIDATQITEQVYRDLPHPGMLFTAQMSTESSLQWLLEEHLAEKINYRWRASANDPSSLLNAMKEIDERLRNPE